jgi:hypothetical protein
VPGFADDPVTFTATLRISRETVHFLAGLLHQRRLELGTRRGTRSLARFARPCSSCSAANTAAPCPAVPHRDKTLRGKAHYSAKGGAAAQEAIFAGRQTWQGKNP